MKILFIIRSAKSFHSYQNIVKALCGRGHNVRVFFDKEWTEDNLLEPMEKFKNEFANFNYDWLMTRCDRWVRPLFIIRALITYRKYLIIKNQSIFYRRRFRNNCPFALRLFLMLPSINLLLQSNICGVILKYVEDAIPSDSRIKAQLLKESPDALVAAVGNIRINSSNTEYMKAAKALGIPTISPAMSWDSLTTKTAMPVTPDILLVWNETQAKEAKDHHDFPPERTRIINASMFDDWFKTLKPFSTKAEFCSRCGLDENNPIVVYLGSSYQMAGDETWLVADLRDALDASSDARVRKTQLVVRPHPSSKNSEFYKNFRKPGVFILFGRGGLTDTDAWLRFFYDTLYYSVAAAGMNTSAMIDAIIADKPVIGVITEKYRQTQVETKHFQQLLGANALELVHTPAEFAETVRKLLDGGDRRRIERQEFIKKFIRPLGLEKSAGELAAEEIEKLVKTKLI